MTSHKRHVLLTGFEPFGGQRLNASALVVNALDGREVAGRIVRGVVLPCVFGRSVETILAQLGSIAPDLVISLGEAGGRAEVSVERVAINVSDAPIPDNSGAQPTDEPVVEGGPVAYWSTLPIKAIVGAIREQNIPAEISDSAGTFVCNHVFYSLMHAVVATRGVRAGFIHVPYVPAQVTRALRGTPTMSLDSMVSAIETAIEVSLSV